MRVNSYLRSMASHQHLSSPPQFNTRMYKISEELALKI